MKQTAALPAPIIDGLKRIQTATDRLVLAVERADSEAVEDALAERGEMIEALEPQVVAFRAQYGELADKSLRPASTALEEGAGRALTALEAYRTKSVTVLKHLAQERVALRAYGDQLPTEKSLDRSG